MAANQWPMPDGLNQLINAAEGTLEAILVEPPEQFRDPNHQLRQIWTQIQEAMITTMLDEHHKVRHVQRMARILEVINQFYQQEGDYMQALLDVIAEEQQHLAREQQQRVQEQVAQQRLEARNDEPDEINLNEFYIGVQRRQEADNAQIIREQRRQQQQLNETRINTERYIRNLYPEEVELDLVDIFGDPDRDRFGCTQKYQLDKESDCYAGPLYKPGVKPKQIREKPYFTPHEIKIRHPRHTVIEHFYKQHYQKVDVDLIAYLQQEAMYLPRAPGLALMLKEKARRWIEEFDTTGITRAEQTTIIGNAVNAAMLPSKPEVELAEQQSNLLNRYTVARHNSYFSTGDMIYPAGLGPLASSSQHIVTEAIKYGVSAYLTYSLVFNPAVIIRAVDTSHAILNLLATRLQSTMGAYAMRWLPSVTGISSAHNNIVNHLLNGALSNSASVSLGSVHQHLFRTS